MEFATSEMTFSWRLSLHPWNMGDQAALLHRLDWHAFQLVSYINQR